MTLVYNSMIQFTSSWVLKEDKIFIKCIHGWIDKKKTGEEEYYWKSQDKQMEIQEKQVREQLFIIEMKKF